MGNLCGGGGAEKTRTDRRNSIHHRNSHNDSQISNNNSNHNNSTVFETQVNEQQSIIDVSIEVPSSQPAAVLVMPNNNDLENNSNIAADVNNKSGIGNSSSTTAMATTPGGGANHNVGFNNNNNNTNNSSSANNNGSVVQAMSNSTPSASNTKSNILPNGLLTQNANQQVPLATLDDHNRPPLTGGTTDELQVTIDNNAMNMLIQNTNTNDNLPVISVIGAFDLNVVNGTGINHANTNNNRTLNSMFQVNQTGSNLHHNNNIIHPLNINNNGQADRIVPRNSNIMLSPNHNNNAQWAILGGQQVMGATANIGNNTIKFGGGVDGFGTSSNPPPASASPIIAAKHEASTSNNNNNNQNAKEPNQLLLVKTATGATTVVDATRAIILPALRPTGVANGRYAYKHQVNILNGTTSMTKATSLDDLLSIAMTCKDLVKNLMATVNSTTASTDGGNSGSPLKNQQQDSAQKLERKNSTARNALGGGGGGGAASPLNTNSNSVNAAPSNPNLSRSGYFAPNDVMELAELRNILEQFIPAIGHCNGTPAVPLSSAQGAGGIRLNTDIMAPGKKPEDTVLRMNHPSSSPTGTKPKSSPSANGKKEQPGAISDLYDEPEGTGRRFDVASPEGVDFEHKRMLRKLCRTTWMDMAQSPRFQSALLLEWIVHAHELGDIFFPGEDAKAQVKRLVHFIDMALRHIDATPTEFHEFAFRLGHKHYAFGVTRAHLELVTKMVMRSLASSLGLLMTQLTEEAFELSFKVLTDGMLEGAAVLKRATETAANFSRRNFTVRIAQWLDLIERLSFKHAAAAGLISEYYSYVPDATSHGGGLIGTNATGGGGEVELAVNPSSPKLPGGYFHANSNGKATLPIRQRQQQALQDHVGDVVSNVLASLGVPGVAVNDKQLSLSKSQNSTNNTILSQEVTTLQRSLKRHKMAKGELVDDENHKEGGNDGGDDENGSSFADRARKRKKATTNDSHGETLEDDEEEQDEETEKGDENASGSPTGPDTPVAHRGILSAKNKVVNPSTTASTKSARFNLDNGSTTADGASNTSSHRVGAATGAGGRGGGPAAIHSSATQIAQMAQLASVASPLSLNAIRKYGTGRACLQHITHLCERVLREAIPNQFKLKSASTDEDGNPVDGAANHSNSGNGKIQTSGGKSNSKTGDAVFKNQKREGNAEGDDHPDVDHEVSFGNGDEVDGETKRTGAIALAELLTTCADDALERGDQRAVSAEVLRRAPELLLYLRKTAHTNYPDEDFIAVVINLIREKVSSVAEKPLHKTVCAWYLNNLQKDITFAMKSLCEQHKFSPMTGPLAVMELRIELLPRLLQDAPTTTSRAVERLGQTVSKLAQTYECAEAQSQLDSIRLVSVYVNNLIALAVHLLVVLSEEQPALALQSAVKANYSRFRGTGPSFATNNLRPRIGIHWAQRHEVSLEAVSRSSLFVYRGECISTVTDICVRTAGGQILMSSAANQRLSSEIRNKSELQVATTVSKMPCQTRFRQDRKYSFSVKALNVRTLDAKLAEAVPDALRDRVFPAQGAIVNGNGSDVDDDDDDSRSMESEVTV